MNEQKAIKILSVSEEFKEEIPYLAEAYEVVNQGGTPLSGYCPRCKAQLTKPSSPVGCKWCLQRLSWEGGE